MRLYSRRNPNETKRWATLAALLLVLQATAAAGAEEEGFSTPFAPEFFKEECLRKQQSSHDTDDNDGDPLSTVDEYLGRWVTGLSNPSVFVSSLELLLFFILLQTFRAPPHVLRPRTQKPNRKYIAKGGFASYVTALFLRKRERGGGVIQPPALVVTALV